MPKPNSDHKENCSTEEQIHKIEPLCAVDINLLEHPHEAELCEYSDKKDLEVLQYKDNLFPTGLVPLQEPFDFNDVARKPKIESIETDVEDAT